MKHEYIMTFKPKLRNPEQLKSVIENPINPLLRSCITCDNFNEATEQCKLWNTRPPARVIAYGCDQYSDLNWIPF